MKPTGILRKKAWQPRTEMGRAALKLFHVLVWLGTFMLLPAIAEAAKKGRGGLEDLELTKAEGVANRPLVLMTALAALSLLPFVIIMVTSFVKIAVVLSIIRQALGTQQIPPTPVITGLAIILTVYVMHPVGLQMKRAADEEVAKENSTLMDSRNVDLIIQAARKSEGPMREFLMKHSHEKDRQMFYKVAYRLRAPEDRDDLKMTDLIIVVPSFVISELTEAFQIGFVIFVPFLIIDMVVSNILMALGMQMLSPTTISLPFKVLLFVLVDGWYLLTKGLVLGYQ
ncbi:MAG: type III secretion system export apparatus subunit SctR [Myxococcota bacterium]